MTNAFDSVLIANRGEIACRVIRTARSMGLRTIAVYSDADADAPHVRAADEAVRIGPPPVGQSYLDIDAVLGAAAASRAMAVHPGYGFLSENAAFAAACADKGLVFIGPGPEAIDLMGDKAKAKRRMIEAGVPCVPGYQGEDQSDARLLKEAGAIGFPIMVKAAAGGGGRGMRLVADAKALPDALGAARSEAENAFGSGVLILEKAIMQPRHVEIQIFADAHGGVIHLGERDCSVQRRHQKVLEEAPCPVMTAPLRDAMGAAAVKAARDINYLGAGTVEFLLDKSGDFYFLEMNTRLQVEHPVTECVTGRDLVAMQIAVAQGAPLPMTQQDVALNGAAIEARLYAEDVGAGFLPATGPVDFWRPAHGDGVRIDAGVESGGAVSPFYDPMLAKIIAHGPSRDVARRKLISALKRTALFGVATNKAFLIDALNKPEFAAGEATTAFIAEAFHERDLAPAPLSDKDAAAAAILLFARARAASQARAIAMPTALLNWSSATSPQASYRFDALAPICIEPISKDAYIARIGDVQLAIDVDSLSEHDATLNIDGKRTTVIYNLPDASFARVQFTIDGRDHDLVDENAIIASAGAQVDAGAVVAPMHGLIVELCVEPGAHVAKGDRLAVLEAMKMQHELRAEANGTVADIHCKTGDQVAADAVLLEIDVADV